MPSSTVSMIRFFVFICIVLVGFIENSCNKPAVHSKGITFNLIDSLGKISMSYPVSTDTFITWVRFNDCGRPCEEGKYRFQSKGARIFKESGFYWKGEPTDSVYQLTISHSRSILPSKSSDSIVMASHKFHLNQLLLDPSTSELISDTIVNISNRAYSVFQVDYFDSTYLVNTRRLIAFTYIKGNELKFMYELLSKNRDELFARFFEDCKRNLFTVRIEDGI